MEMFMQTVFNVVCYAAVGYWDYWDECYGLINKFLLSKGCENHGASLITSQPLIVITNIDKPKNYQI